MPSKSKKTSDKEIIWQKVSATCCLENLFVSRAAAEYLYKLTAQYVPEQLSVDIKNCSMNEATVVLKSLNTSAMTHHSNGDITNTFVDKAYLNPVVLLTDTERPSVGDNIYSAASPPSVRTKKGKSDDDDKNDGSIDLISQTASTKKRSMDTNKNNCLSLGEADDVSELSRLHENCRKNCVNEPHCLAALGFEKWQTGKMDYDWPSDDEEDDCLVKRKKDVPVGLVNLGATCYVNAFLQLWYHNLAFRNAVFEWTQLEGDAGICESLQYIFGLLECSLRSCVDPSPLIEMLGLDASQQQDAQEFSKLFIELLPCPQIKHMFCGSYDYVTRCSTCKHESRTGSQFTELDLSIEGLSTLDDCMKSFLQVEKLTGDNQYFCSMCQCKQNATRRIELRKLPPVLNIQLLRFVFDRKTGHKKKLSTCLQFPDQLELSADGEQHQYELTAALLHSGISAFSGHYTAHIHKHDHWYSFNDANVVKLRGKKLNLSNEESLDLQPETSTPTSETKKRGNRSKNAYMLVYQKKSFIQSTKDLHPSPVPESVLQKVEEDNSKMSISNHDADIRQTEQMVRVEMKKDQIAELREGLESTSQTEENYHFLPVQWLNEVLEDWSEIKPIDNTALLCRHGKLNWSLNKKYKVISQKKGEFIYKIHRGDKTTVLNRNDSLCYECLKNQLRWRMYKEKTEEDQRTIQGLIMSNPSPDEHMMYWLDKSDYRRWRSLVLKPLEQAAQPTVKVNKSEKDDGADNAEGTAEGKEAAESSTVNGSNSAASSINGDADTTFAAEDSDYRFNADILCDHGNLSSSDKYRQLVPESAWDILQGYFPSAVTMTNTTPICTQCLGEQKVMDVMEEQRKSIVKEERHLLCDLAVLRNRPVLECLTTDTVYCITQHTYKQWKLFLRNFNTQSGLKSIVNSSVICVHGMLCVHPSDDNSIVLLWPYEWDILSTHFHPDLTIEVRSLSTDETGKKNSTSYVTTPEICSECSESRLMSEQMESHHFNNSTIYIRLLTADSQTDADQSISQQSAEEEVEETRQDAKKLKVESEQSEAASSQLQFKRRSVRRKRVRGDKHLRTSSDIKLKDLRVELVKLFAIAPFDQVITLDGRQLEGDDKTLGELKLYPDCLLHLKGVVYDETNMEQMMLEQGVLEEGFRGTGLIANNR